MKPQKVIKRPFSAYGNKMWVEVKFDNGGTWVPSFLELCRIVKAIGDCEAEKYPTGQGRTMVAKFLYAAANSTNSCEELCQQFGVPARDGVETLVQTIPSENQAAFWQNFERQEVPHDH